MSDRHYFYFLGMLGIGLFSLLIGISFGKQSVELNCQQSKQLVIDKENYLCLKVHKLEIK